MLSSSPTAATPNQQPLSNSNNSNPFVEPTSHLPGNGGSFDFIPESESDNDNDSTYPDSIFSDTTSITSSILAYTYENGRRYHSYKGGNYVLPNDEEEQDRLDSVHHMWLLVGEGEVAKAPIKSPQRVLDIGTGTGIWAIEFADQYPSSVVIGTDLSCIQPPFVPPNLRFEIDDCEDTWLYEENYFDYIHIRTLVGAIKDWPNLLRSIYKHLKPGGYVEIQECPITKPYSLDGTYDLETNSYAHYIKHLSEASDRLGRSLDVVSDLPQWMDETGFVDMVHKIEILPIGIWPKDKKYKERGRWGLLNVDKAMEAYGLALFTRVLGMTAEQAKKICADGRVDLFDRKIHMVYNLHFIYARKPEDDTC